MDIRIVKYLLFSLGQDIDGLAGYSNFSPTEHLGCDIDSFDGYREQLKLELQHLGNYVVVFDDVWFCNDWFVDLCHKLGEPKKMDPKLLGLEGAVIVTSRKKEVAQKMVDYGKKLILLALWRIMKKMASF